VNESYRNTTKQAGSGEEKNKGKYIERKEEKTKERRTGSTKEDINQRDN
jgi:hypothetical protein